MLIDAHAHLDKYGAELPAALEEIRRRRIFTLAVAMDVPSYERSREIAERAELVLPTFGVHPKRAPQYAGCLRELGPVIEQSPAIGEIGLDFHWVEEAAQYPAQLDVLEYFLAAAREQKKMINLHTKGAERKILDLLERYDIRRAIVHWYSGPPDILGALIQFGAYFTVGVEVLFSEAIQSIAKTIPDHLLLTETDNPGGLQWLRGVVGMPGALLQVVEKIAELRGHSTAHIERMVEQNLLCLTQDDPWLPDLRALLSGVPSSKPET